MLIAWHDNPELDIEAYDEDLDRMASEIKKRLGEPEKKNPRKALETLNAYFFDENGFHGNRSDYYHSSNSYLNEVIDDREGLPIALSVVYIELARRAGINVVGIPLPGHFVAEHHPEEGRGIPQLIDVFDRGRFLTQDDADALVRNFAGVPLREEHLTPATSQQIILRMLRNLSSLGIDARDPAAALPYVRLQVAADPDDPQSRLSRAILSFQIGRAEDARADIDWLIERKPEGMDLDRLLEWRGQLD
jgi:regulator of sirC expression with transglutaminase-like and TPR domain